MNTARQSHSAIAFASLSDPGRVRVRNEDALAVDPEGRWAILADGMGGYRGGAVAAGIAIAVVSKRLDSDLPPADISTDEAEAALLLGIIEANRDIYRAGVEDLALAGMGTTVVAGVFVPGAIVCAHVGDSRLYRATRDGLEQLTHDHTVLQEQVDDGIMTIEEFSQSPARGLLTRGLGVGPFVEPDAGTHPALPGDVFLWCSDGLTTMLDDDEIMRVLRAFEEPGLAAERLVSAANERGGCDNVSVVIARLPG